MTGLVEILSECKGGKVSDVTRITTLPPDVT